MFILIENGDVYAPDPVGSPSILIANDKIVKMGPVSPNDLRSLGVEFKVINAANHYVLPGLIDPHQHIIGAGGENGFTSRMPEIQLSDIVRAGITTIVGLLGTDTTTRYLTCLHAKAKQLRDEGITAYIHTGGFEVPPTTFFKRVMDDLVIITEVIGIGEIAIADYRWVEPPLHDLARLVTEAMVGGKMGAKAGVTHFHVGSGKARLSLLHQMLDQYDIPPHCLYPTHINRIPELLEDAVKLAQRGAFVDMDTTEENLAECWQAYRKQGGPLNRLTVSSDAHTPGGSPSKLYSQFVACVRDHGLPLPDVLRCFTRNTAEVLMLETKGRLQPHMDADMFVVNRESFDIVHVIARGKFLIRNGEPVHNSQQEQQTEESQAS